MPKRKEKRKRGTASLWPLAAGAAILAVGLIASSAYAVSQAPPQPAKKHVATSKAKTPPPPSVAEQIEALREDMQRQHEEMQQQIDSLKAILAAKDTQLQQAQQTATAAQATASKADSDAMAQQQAFTQNTAAVNQLQSSVADIKGSEDALAIKVTDATTKIKSEVENPDALRYKGAQITPGGYMQFATLYRTRDANSDTADNYGQYPYKNSPDYYMSEFRASGRGSRLSLKAQGKAKGMKFMGYTEIDFLASAGGNETQTNSFSPRLRLAFANVDLPGGWSIAGGQNWSLLQTTRKGIDPLSEWLPSLIDNSYTPGFSYAREGSFRVVKKITPQAWFGFSVENPDTVTTGSCTSSSQCNFTLGEIQGLANSTSTVSPNNGYLNALSGANAITGNPSTNPAPDLVAKLAFEPGWGHFEVKAIGRSFRDRVYPHFFDGTAVSAFVPPQTTSSTATATTISTVGAHNITTEGGGIGVGAILPVVKDKIDFVYQGLAGAGIGRFGVTSGPDTTYRPLINSSPKALGYTADGALVPVKGTQMVVGLDTHPTPKFDWNLYYGGDYYQRVSYFIPKGSTFFGSAPTTANAEAGYGFQFANDSTCNIEDPTTGLPTSTSNGLSTTDTNCSGQTKSVWAPQTQFWYRLYKGREGTVQFGASYAYIWKEAWAGRGPSASGAGTLPIVTGQVTPKSINQIVMTAFRYYLP